MPEPNSLSLMQWGISIAVPAVSGLCGVALGGWLISHREKIGRRHSFLIKQLTDFYSPLLALKCEIETIKKVRLKISQAAGKAWKDMFSKCGENPVALKQLDQSSGDKFKKIIDFDNEYLRENTIPAYRNMVDIFRKAMWLAEKSTTEHFPALLEFVNIWDRYLEDSLPGEVLQELDFSEQMLKDFYDDLQKQNDYLRGKLLKGDT